MRKIIVCIDGTWDKPGEIDKGVSVPSNIEKLYYALNKNDEQVVKYIPGVGTSGGLIRRMLNGATGVELDSKIKEAYAFIVENYQPGDKLYFFGFSRGAYTARSLAGLIRNSGIVKDVKDINEAFEHYRERSSSSHPDSESSIALRKRLSHGPGDDIFDDERGIQEAEEIESGRIEHKGNRREEADARQKDWVTRVKFLGICDTVGSLGLPLPWLRKGNIKRYKFHDITLSSTIDHAYHALAIDEHRKVFTPCVWEKSIHKASDPNVAHRIAAPGEYKSKYGTNKHVQQMWFSGVHANIGGGYPDSALSDITLHWIAANASLRGLSFEYFPFYNPSPHGKLYNSQTWYYELGGNLIRPITLEDGIRVQASYWTPNPLYRYSFNEYISNSVQYRINNKQLYYNPRNVFNALNTSCSRRSSKKVFVDFNGRNYWDMFGY